MRENVRKKLEGVRILLQDAAFLVRAFKITAEWLERECNTPRLEAVSSPHQPADKQHAGPSQAGGARGATWVGATEREGR